MLHIIFDIKKTYKLYKADANQFKFLLYYSMFSEYFSTASKKY